ncbi:MAG: hypothetical protein EBY57_08480, partial [Actinobacteria bacterium]|nr:hypothetical protein [Actinomycetota bacterium]
MSVEGLSSAVTGLLAHRRRLDVISHNVANANTEGYSRQRVDLTAASGSASGIWSGSSSSLYLIHLFRSSSRSLRRVSNR